MARSSTAIASVEYDEAKRLLHVQYRTGTTVYTYVGVPRAIYDALMRAPSMGAYFAKHIQKQYSLRA